MSPNKSKIWYSNNCLHFKKCKLCRNIFWIGAGLIASFFACRKMLMIVEGRREREDCLGIEEIKRRERERQKEEKSREKEEQKQKKKEQEIYIYIERERERDERDRQTERERERESERERAAKTA
jgi:hypothetical protein